MVAALAMAAATAGAQEPPEASASGAEIEGGPNRPGAETLQQVEDAAEAPSADSLRAQSNRLSEEAQRLRKEQKFAEAAAAGEQLLQVHRKLTSEDHHIFGVLNEWLAKVYAEAKDWGRAEARWREAVAWRVQHAAKDSGALADARRGRARALYRLQRYDEAIDVFKEVIPTYNQLERPIDAAWIFEWIASSHRGAGRDGQAVEAYSEFFSRIANLDHNNDLAGELFEYAKTLCRLKRYDDAIEQFAAAAEAYERTQRPVAAAWTFDWIGAAHRDAGRDEEAATAYAECLARIAKSDDSQDVSSTLFEYAKTLYRLKRYDDAMIQFEAGIDRFQELNEPAAEATVINDLAAAYFDAGDYRRAEPYFARALAIRKRVLGERHPHYATSLTNLALTYCAAGRHAAAEPLLRQSLSIKRESLGEKHPGYAASLGDLAKLYEDLGDHAQAEPLYRQSLKIAREVLGEKHPDYAWTLTRLGLLLIKMGDLSEAASLHQELLTIRKETVGEQSAEYATSLNYLAYIYAQMGNRAQAETYYEKALEISKKVSGKGHVDYAWSLSNLASLSADRGDYAFAERLYRQALDVFNTALGDQHPDYALGLNNLANLYVTLGDYDQAVPMLRQASQIWKDVHGVEHPHYALSLHNLAHIASALGDYAEAERLGRQAMEIRKKVFGDRHPDYAVSLNNLAQLYSESGEYARALPLLEQAMDIYRRSFGEKHPDYALSLDNLAGMYVDLGDPHRAEALQLEALQIRKEALGEKHRLYAVSLNNLGGLYRTMQDYERSARFYWQALEIRKETLGEHHPDYAVSLNNLAAVCGRKGDYRSAESFYRQSLKIVGEIFGQQHDDYAEIVSHLAEMYYETGDFTRAESFFKQAVEKKKAIFGEEHRSYVTSMWMLARLYRVQGDVARAEPLFREALEITRNHAESNALALTEQQQLAFEMSLRAYLDAYLSCRLADDRYEEEAFQAVLSWKGATLVRQRAVRAAGEQPELAGLLNELQPVVRRWAAMVQAAPQHDGQWQRRLADLTAQKERLEAEFVRRSSKYRQANLGATVAVLQAALPADAALVDYLEYWRSTPVQLTPRGGLGMYLEAVEGGAKILEIAADGAAADDGRLKPGDVIVAVAESDADFVSTAGLALNEAIARIVGEAGTRVRLTVRRSDSPPGEETIIDLTRAALPYQKAIDLKFERALAAFVVRPGAPVEMFDLGSVEPVSEAVDEWRASFGMSPQAQAAGQLLRERIWQPLEAALGDATTVLVSPDGALGRLPFGALPGKQPGSYLVEDYNLALVPVPQLIPSMVADVGRRELDKEILLLGGVDYDSRDEDDEATATRPTAPVRPWQRRPADALALRAVAGESRWQFLAGSDSEVGFIGDLYRRATGLPAGSDRIAELRGAAATEERFRDLAPRAYILHLATHGFFAAADKKSTAEMFVADLWTALTGVTERRDAIRGYSPGLLSGLVLAGANDRIEIPDDPHQLAKLPDDGILTADEIAFLPLAGAQLVVLSACESGLGETAGGEGLLGIQRAFQLAGARTTIATLWKVNDEATRRIMEEFYRNYLQNQMSPLEALRAAQRWALDNPDLVPRGADAPHDAIAINRLPPQYWAAFTLSGDWR
jgi:tetratricopeptide (TPR) repeat protein/CHAT domain-containing protein